MTVVLAVQRVMVAVVMAEQHLLALVVATMAGMHQLGCVELLTIVVLATVLTVAAARAVLA